MAHTALENNLECSVCHDFVPEKSFSLVGHSGSWGALSEDNMTLLREAFSSWANSNYTDSLHAEEKITCAGCHRNALPGFGDTVENSRCLECHGPMDRLAKKTDPKNRVNSENLVNFNPHASHLGEINCTVCHHAHYPSKSYCLECHRTFKMKIQGAETEG